MRDHVGTVIVGGGIGGVALAYYLADLGEADITVIEARELASGCTGGSLGGVRQQFSTPSEVELAIRGRDFWRSFEQTFHYHCPYYQDGYLMLTGRQEIFEKLGRAAEVQRAAGAPNVEMVSANVLADIVPWLSCEGLIGGCWTPEDGRVNPTDGVYGLAAAARRLGVKFLQRTRVAKIERATGGWRLHTPTPITARRVIVVAGLGSPQLLNPFGLDLPITAMMVHYAFTTPIIQGQRLPVTVDLDSGFCVAREQDAAVITMLESSYPEGYGVDDMLIDFADAAAVRAPVFIDASIRSSISAAADATGGDGHPFIGEVEPGLWTMTGFDGHGTMQGPAIAKFTANLIAGIADPVLDAGVFDPHRVATENREWLRAARK